MSILANNTGGFSSGPASGLTSAAGAPNIRSGTYTLACRMRFNAVPTTPEVMGIALTDNASAGGAYIGRFSGDAAGQFSAIRYNGVLTAQQANMAGAYATGAWKHFALTYDGTNIRAYLNGALISTVASVTTTCPNTTANAISMACYGSYVIQDAFFASRVLSAAEVQILATGRNYQVFVSQGVCFGWYPEFFDGSLVDYSGRGNNATVNYNGGSGTNPAPNNEDAGVPWGRTTGRIWVPLGTAVATDGDGLTLFNGSAVPTVAVAESGAGQTILNASGVPTSAVAESATGLTRLNASGTPTAAVAESADGRTRFNASGTPVVTASVAADGRTVFNGASSPAIAVAEVGAGQTVFNASGTASVAFAAVADGRTLFNASGTGGTGFAAVGQTLFDGRGTATVAVAAAGAGQTLLNGTSVAANGAAAEGLTRFNGIGTAAAAVAAGGAGLTRFNGTSTATAASGGGGGAAQLGGSTANRRHSLVYGTRRKIR